MEGFITTLMSQGPAPGCLLGLFIKATLLCVLGFAVCIELSQMPAVVRHRVALATIVCLALLPVLAKVISPWYLSVLPGGADTPSVTGGAFGHYLVAAYVAVAVWMLCRLAVDVSRVARVDRRARDADWLVSKLPMPGVPRRRVRVKMSDDIRAPLTWGWWKPSVLLPADAGRWCRDELAMVMEHELSHIERADWARHLFSRCVFAVYWPVPGMRALMRQLSLSAEQACDDRVLAAGVAAADYAAMLLNIARGNRVPATVSLGQGSELGIRIRYMVEGIVDHSVFAQGAVATFTACIALTLPLATLQFAQRPELPAPPWGIITEAVPGPAPSAEGRGIQFDDSVRLALEPGPARPEKPPLARHPPEPVWREKPTIPPP